ncbi:unnamed protein product [Leptidea sinapis]|uniref:Peptidase M14 domain-containing protein n=1 Tax=Leptidea sinapis TaxID=189913 RepID=A0A5E4QLB6_9NEOP|nr:unnamed protein product [Leptidea sinapis]
MFPCSRRADLIESAVSRTYTRVSELVTIWICNGNNDPVYIVHKVLVGDVNNKLLNSIQGSGECYPFTSITNFEDRSKPIIFIDGGTHGREWLTIPPVTYAIHKLVEDVTEPDLLEKFDWILLPMVNPDGYNHSIEIVS